LPFFEKLNNLDRRIIFFTLALSVILPLVFPLKILPAISEPVKNVHKHIEKLPEGSVCVLCFDYYATTAIECEPIAFAVGRHLLSRNMKVITYNLIPDGTGMSMKVMRQLGEELGKEYGKDYVVMGFKTGAMVAIKSFDEDVHMVFHGLPFR